ncbi:amino acid adenylation domain-containing protein [Streptomyces albogriseolus]|uniref:amino acid adenylation domain-containing protein n=1 Tax=Streptomyces albogriseolus TaxID=1887 RepID=UPI0036FAC54C
MPRQSVLSVPRLGEGIVEVRIVRLLKRPGDPVAKDEVVYEMEHDKAAVEIESPVAGVLDAWSVAEGDVVPIGGEVARLSPAAPDPADRDGEPAGAEERDTAGRGSGAPGASVLGVPGRTPAGTRRIPPRTRAHARRLGIDEGILASLPAAGSSLMPADLERYRAAQAEGAGTEAAGGRDPEPAVAAPGDGFADVGQSPRQIELNRALRASRDTTVPAVVSRTVTEQAIQDALRAHQGSGFSTAFQAFARAAARAAAGAPRLRSRRLTERTLRVYEHVDLGIACATPEGDLTVAVVRRADTLDAAGFDDRYADAVERALAGTSQADGSVTLILSHLGDRGPTLAVPVVVPPAAATLFLGAVEDTAGAPVRRMVLAFDHTLLNGQEAAAYLDAVADALAEAGRAAPEPEAGRAAPEHARPRADRAGAAPAADTPGTVLRRLTDLAAGVLGHDVDPGRPLGEQGLDSARALRLIREIRAAFDVELPATAVWRHPTLRSLAARLTADGAEATAGERTDQGHHGPERGGDEDAVAVIGMACRVPGADDAEAFWDLLAEGRRRITEVPAGRLAGAPPEGFRAGLLDRVDLFDADFFQVTPRQAASMDPQQRALLELSWHALEHAGLNPDDLAGRPVGVYASACSYDYREQLVTREAAADGYATTGTFPAFLANRVSHLYDFTGPSITVDTACSGALTALALAEAALRRGDCEIALAGAANLLSNAFNARAYRKAGMLSPRGELNVFDEEADGFVRGEGAGWLVLKPLRRALADGDPVLAVVRAAAVNHGGRAAALTAPNPRAQTALIRTALDRAGLRGADLGYLEAHGTGTPLGDPVELDAFREALADDDTAGAPARGAGPGGRIWVGSAKANIGHLEGASGLAGVVKAVQALRYGLIPGTPGFTRLNPHISLDGTPLAVAGRAVPWPAQEGGAPRRAAVSAFGFGGSNAHVILEEAPVPPRMPDGTGAPAGTAFAVPLSAATPGALRRLAAALADLVGSGRGPALDAVAWTLQSGRRALTHRALLVVRDTGELAARARDVAGGRNVPAPSDPRLADWLAGGELSTDDWAALWPGRSRPRRAPLVPYPFEGRPYWLPATPATPAADAADAGGPALTVRRTDPLAAHRVAGTAVLPGAALLDVLAGGGPVSLGEVRFLAPVPVTEGGVRLRRLREDGGTLAVEYGGRVCARAAEATGPARPPRPAEPGGGPAGTVDLPAVLARHGIETGPVYRVLRDVRRAGGRVTARILAPLAEQQHTRRIAWLDAALQTSCALLGDTGPRVAAALDRIEWTGQVPEEALLTVHRVGGGAHHTVVDLEAVTPDGAVVLTVNGLRLHPPAAPVAPADDPPSTGWAADPGARGSVPVYGAGPGARADGREAETGVAGPAGAAGVGGAAHPAGAPDSGGGAHPGGAAASAGAAYSGGAAGRGGLAGPVAAADPACAAHPAGAVHSAGGADSGGAAGPGAPEPVVAAVEGAEAGGGVRVLVPEWVPEAGGGDREDGPVVLVHDHDSAPLAAAAPAGAVRCPVGPDGLDRREFADRLSGLSGPVRVALLVDGSAWSDDDAGVAALRGRLRTLLTIGRELAARARPATVTLVTTALAAPDGRTPAPGAALQGALLGALRTLPRECPALTAAAVDLAPGATPADLAAALAEPGRTAVPLIAVRDGRRSRQVYTDLPAPAPAADGDGFTHGGGYVLFGGAGGIGAEVARHLARRYRAGLLLVGRSPAGAATRALLGELTALGGRARYLRADVTDPAAQARVLAECRELYGRLDGVVHSVGSVSAARLEELTDADLDRVLATKVTAVTQLRRTLAGSASGRSAALVVFSSVAGLFGSVGGLNYAAANAWLGHYATATGTAADGPAVRALDWGLWRATGLARRYAGHVRREYPGLTDFAPERGVAALEAGMSGNHPHTVALAGDPEPLRPLTGRPTARSGPDDAAHRLDDYARAVLAHRMSELGLPPALAARSDAESAARLLRAVPEHRRLLAAVCELLAAHDRAGRPVPTAGELAATRSALLADHPDLYGHVSLLDRTLDAYGPVLRGELPPAAVLFPGGDLGAVSAVYSGNQLFDPVNRAAAESLAQAAADIGPGARVLEIGAGVGGTTASALAALDARGVTGFSYVYTDVSPAFLQHGRRRFGDRIVPRLLDIEKNPAAQDFADGSADLVVASNVLHATRDLARTLDHIRQLLAPGGRLVLVEMVVPAAVYTLTFGLTDGWWRYVDEQWRLPHGPLLDVGRWRALLESRGWRLHGTDLLREAPGCVALLTCRPAGSGASAADDTGSRTAAPAVETASPPAGGDPSSVLAVAEELRALVRELLGDPAAEVPGWVPWQELGVDSLLNMEFVEELGRRYGPVKPTALFEHRTVDDLARALASRTAPPAPDAAGPGHADGQDLVRRLTALVAELTARDPSLIDADTAFPELGVDSLLHEEFCERLRALFPAADVPATLPFEHPTPRALARHLGRLPAAGPAPGAGPAARTGTAPRALPGAQEEPRSFTAAAAGSAPARAAVADSPQAATAAAAARSWRPVPAPGEDAGAVAVVGLAGRYPGAADVDAFWDLLVSGDTPVREVPAERWDWRTARTRGGGYARYGCFLDGIDAFEPAMFRIRPRDAALMDPQERLFLEVAREAFETAGYARHTLAGSHGGPRVGVFAGVTSHSHLLAQRDARAAGADNPEYAVTAAASVANRVSHAFDLSGPSLTVDTMCSSSLTALHLACRALLEDEADLALAGGVNLYLHPDRFAGLCALGMPSRGDRTRAFGAGGDGFVPGEGAGAVVLKRLDRARADGDTVLAVIRATGLNHGGGTGGYTVPNPGAQAALIESTLRRAGADPWTVGYVEAHGTGTELGDPVELRALALAFEQAGRDGPVRVGSVKSNIGHGEAAAGIAGLTKAVLQLRHRHLVPTLHAERLNPKLGLENTALRVQTAAEPWTAPDGPRRAAVSSFGAGGANAHVILEEYLEEPAADTPHGEAPAPGPVLVPVAAPDAGRLRTVARDLARVACDFALADIAYTLHGGRERFAHRAAVVARDGAELRAALLALAEGAAHPALVTDAGQDGAGPAARSWVADGACPAPAGGRRVPLPVTPFARERCVPPEARTSPMPLTDTVHGPASRTVTARLGAASRWVADHVVDGEPLLPGAFHPELVHEALISADENPYRTVLLDLLWPRPAAGLPMEVRTELGEPDERGARRFSTTVGGSVIAQGRTEPAASPSGPVRPLLVYRPDEFDAHLGDLDAETFYEAFAAHGFAYGPLYRTVRRAVVHGEDVTAELRLPDGEDPDGRHVLHPALFDGACQTAARLLLADGPGTSRRRLRPLAVDRLTVHEPVTGRIYVHAQRVRLDERARVHVFDLRLIDPVSGSVLALAEGFRVRVDEPADGTVTGPATAVERPVAHGTHEVPGDAEVPVHGYRLDWRPALAGGPEPGPPRGPLWVIGDGALTARLRTSADVVLPPARAADESALAATARAHGTPAAVLVDLTGAGPALGTDPLTLPETARAWTPFAEDTLGTVFGVLRALVRSRALDGARVLLVTAWPADDPDPSPTAHALHSLVRTVAGETGRFTVRLAGVDTGRVTAGELLAEAGRDDADWVRLTPGGRHTAVLYAEPAPEAGDAGPLLDGGGSYLVTGGLGGLGRRIAADLLRRGPANVVLVGRSPADEDALRELRRGAGPGAAVHYRRCDVADAEQVAALAAWLDDAGIRLRGVVHTAGVLRDGFLRGKSLEAVEEVCRGKVLGALHLDAALAGHPLDFFLLCSSLAALVGNQGQSDYAFANGFLDGFARRRARWAARGQRPGRTLSAGWPVLADAGMTLEAHALDYLAQTYGLRPVATRDAVRALWPRLAAARSPETACTALVAGDTGVWERATGSPGARPAASPAGPDPSPPDAPGAADGADALRWVARKVEETTGVPAGTIDPDARLDAYGIDSIASMRLSRILEDDLGRVPLSVLLDSSSVRDLTDRLRHDHGPRLEALAAAAACAPEPFASQSSASGPFVSGPSAPEPPVSGPSAPQSLVSGSSVSGPSALQPSAPEPSAPEPFAPGLSAPGLSAPQSPVSGSSVSGPSALQPSVSGPSAPEPSASGPSASQPSAPQPSASQPSAPQPSAPLVAGPAVGRTPGLSGVVDGAAPAAAGCVLPERLVGMWAADQAAAPEAPYNVSLAWRMPADADRTALGAAVDALVRRHPVLGCRVRPLDGRPALQPAPEPPALVIRTVAGAALDGAVRAEGDRRLRTSAEPLLRAVLWEPEDGGAPVLQLTTHHMVVDGRSADLLGRDLAALSTGRELPPALPFATAVRREVRRAEDDASGRAEAERRFAERLADGRAAGVLFPGGGERAGAAGGHREHRLPAALADTLARVAEDAGVPRFTVLLGAFATALSRTTGHRSFLVAVPVYGRGGGQEDHSVGCFATTVPLRVDLDPGRPVHAWLRELNQEVRAALGRSVVPYPRLAELCREAGGPDAVPTVTLAYQNWERDAAGTAAGAGWEQVYRRGQRGHFDLGLEVTDTGHGLDVLANHRTAVLGADEADAFVEELRRSAAELARGAGGTLGELLDPAAGTLTARIAATARRLPDAVAVEDRDTRLSYAELQQVSDEIARRVHHAAGPGEPVAVLMHRSARLPAVLLGILKSGRPYVPLDESYPSERLALVVERAGCRVAVADRELTWLLPQGVHVVDPRGPAGPDVPHGPPPTPPTPDSPAYLMFTSGSTGQPKGVAVTHGNVVHTLEALAATVGVDERAPARLLAVTTVCFDISVLELFLPLLTGGTVVVAERADVTDARRLARLLTERDIGLMQATPAGWHLLVEGGWTGRGTLTALCGGEALPPNLAAALAARTAALWNVYGPTEATIWSTIAPVTASGPVHLGDPIGATRLLLTEVDGRRPPAPGEPGELWIGGAGVAQGYWRQPELTAERFTGHPLSPEGGGRWFRTGDLVRRDEEGRLLFLGRADSQVKVRGHRMELGEIEEVLGRHPAIARVVVAVRGEGPTARLTAVAVPQAGAGLPALPELREHAASVLPPWMLPDRLAAVAGLPLTPNGKVDRKAAVALADAALADAALSEAAEAAPTTHGSTGSQAGRGTVTYERLVREVTTMWRELLELDDIPTDQRFFDLGGNSLLLGQLFARLEETYPGTGLELADLFARPTVADLAGLLAGRLGARPASAQAAPPPAGAAPARPSRRELRRAFRLGDDQR